MSTPESQASNGQVDLEALFARIDQHAHRSDPDHEMEAYFQVVKMGEAALPSLFVAGEMMSPWRMRAIIEITDNMTNSINLPLSGAPYGDFLNVVLNWGEQNGYLSDESKRDT